MAADAISAAIAGGGVYGTLAADQLLATIAAQAGFFLGVVSAVKRSFGRSFGHGVFLMAGLLYMCGVRLR